MTRDLRKYSKQTNFRLLVGFFVLLFLIGDGLIYFIYGKGAAIFGMFCLLIGLAPLILIWGILFIMEQVVKKANQDEEATNKSSGEEA